MLDANINAPIAPSKPTFAEPDQITSEMVDCLTLVAWGETVLEPDEWAMWLSLAREELRGITLTELRSGAQFARQHCCYPKQIIPAILAVVRSSFQGSPS